MLAYEHTPQNNRPNTVAANLVLAKDFEKTFHVLNFKLEDEIGSGKQGTPEAAIRWGSRYKFSPTFEAGFETLSDFGHLNDFSGFNSQEHYIGPAAYGEFEVFSGKKNVELEYRVVYLLGVSEAAKDGDFIFEIGHEFEF